ncbi:MAG: type II toxin-antitoxin system RelE/ParE family toxin [Alphaproteobacteria bacterium]
MAYRLTRRAEADVIEIFVNGAERFGLEHAEAYHAALERTFELIALHPRLAQERTEIVPPVRIHPSGAHVIVYTVDAADDVLIVRVRHGREYWIDDPS